MLLVLDRLVDQGNSVIVIEHNLDVIKTADWLVDMGPEGGSRGGMVVVEGTPEEVAACPESHTGAFLAPLLRGRAAQLHSVPSDAPTQPGPTSAPKRRAKAAKVAAAARAVRS